MKSKDAAIENYIRSVTKEISPEQVDLRWAIEVYESREVLEGWKLENELVASSQSRLFLFGKTNVEKFSEKPEILIWLSNNIFCPMYCLLVRWREGVWRAFIRVDSKEYELFRNKPLEIILLRKSACTYALEVDLSSANPKFWQLVEANTLPNEGYLGDEAAGKALVVLTEDWYEIRSPSDQLFEGWLMALVWEASDLVDHYYEPVEQEHLEAEREIVLKSSFGNVFEGQDHTLHRAYKLLKNTLDSVGLIALLNKIEVELDKAPKHAWVIYSLLRCLWFSPERTHFGQCIPSLEEVSDEDSDSKWSYEIVPIEAELLGERAKVFWERYGFDFPYLFKRLVGPGNCPIDWFDFVASAPKYEGDIEKGEEYVKDLLTEATACKQWTIPFGAYVQIEAGEIEAIKLQEAGSQVFGVLVNRKGEFSIWSADPLRGRITTSGYEARPVGKAVWHDDKPFFDEAGVRRVDLGLEILIACIIRDFWVVEERESVFGASVHTKKARRLRGDFGKKVIVYLPRIRYIRDRKDLPDSLDLKTRKPHWVTGHLRKALHASEDQIRVGRKYGIWIPEGFTFVRPHRRGDEAQQRAFQERERIYRSRSALQAIRALKPVQSQEKDSWFTYELKVKEWLAQNGYEVEHLAGNRNGDGGVDIQAVRGKEHLLVQCKYWTTERIPPRVIREMMGTLQTFPKGSRGVIITVGELTDGAKRLALEHGIQYIERVDFQSEIKAKL